MIVVGVDPGLSGAIAVLIDGGASVYDMPTIAYSKTGYVKRAVDLPALAKLMGRWSGAVVWLERVNAFPGQGVGSMFSLGMSYWGVAGVVTALGYPLQLVLPREWKAHYGLGKDKGKALSLASQLYPQASLSRQKDHNRAEALLIARYGLTQLSLLV